MNSFHTGERTLSAPPIAVAQMSDKKETLVSEMLRLTNELADVVSRETKFLLEAKWLDMHRLNPEKSSLALRYSTLAQALNDVPVEVLGLDDDTPALRAAAATLDQAVRENARHLQIHMDANRRVAELIANAAREATTPCFAYGSGKPGSRGRYGLQSPPVSVIKLL